MISRGGVEDDAGARSACRAISSCLLGYSSGGKR